MMNNCFIDLFAGCGGLSLGLMKAGWQGIFAVERDPMAFQTFRANLVDRQSDLKFSWPAWLPCKAMDIAAFVEHYESELRRLRGKIALVAGGPPCQGFSFAGRRNSNDRRNQLIEHYLEIVRLVNPRYVLIENVRGISVGFREADTARGGTSYADRIAAKLQTMEYDVFTKTLFAADYGVPQRRPRFIMIGIRRSRRTRRAQDPFLLETRIRQKFLKKRGLKPPVAAKLALSDLEVYRTGSQPSIETPGFEEIRYRGPRTAYQRMMHQGMNGEAPNSLRLPRHRPETVKRFSYLVEKAPKGVNLSAKERAKIGTNKHVIVVLNPNAPSPTLTTLPDDLLHYSEPRILTVREFARLQSFPDWFEFHGKYTTGGMRRTKETPRYTQVGNAVPPLLAEGLGLLLSEYDLRYAE